MTQRPLPLWLLILSAILLWGGEYLCRDLWEPDEARYAYISGEMATRGDWFVMHRHGETYAHKPPLMFWLIHAGSKITGGYDSVSTRLPSLFGILCALWAAIRLTGRWAGPRAGWWTAGILSTSFLFWNKGGMGQIDALLCGLEMLALYQLFTYNADGRKWRPLLAYVFMGLAILAKGPVGLLVPLGAYLFGSLMAGEGRKLRRLHWIWGLGISLAFPAAWLFTAWKTGAPQAYLDELLFAQNVGRAAGSLGHVQPGYYFLTRFPLQFLPWTPLLPLAWASLRDDPEKEPHLRRLAGWGLFVILFFTLSSSKRDLYILLAYPAMAMILGMAADRLAAQHYPRYQAAAPKVILGILGIGALGALCYPALPFNRWALLPPLAVICATLLMQCRTKNPTRRLAGFIGGMLLIQFTIGTFVYAAINPLKAPHAIREAARTHLAHPHARLIIYHMKGEIFALYSGTIGLQVNNPTDLRQALREQEHGLVALQQKHYAQIPKWIREEALSKPHAFNMGSKELYWCSFDMRPE